MRFMRFTSLLVSAAAALALSGPAFADELQVPNPAASSDTPTSGMSMDKVEAKYGAPSRRVPAVGGGRRRNRRSRAGSIPVSRCTSRTITSFIRS